MRNEQSGRRPDPHDFSEGWEEWEYAVVACAAYFRLIGFSRTCYASVDLPTIDDVRAFLADAGESQYILVYAVTAAGQEVCISGARFKHFGENAVSAAALRALDLARHGQDQASAIWIRIRMVVQDLQRGRREGETVH